MSKSKKFNLTGTGNELEDLEPSRTKLESSSQLQPPLELVEKSVEEETPTPKQERHLMYDDGTEELAMEEEFSLTKEGGWKKRGRGRTERQKKKAYASYRELKKKVVEMEKKNKNRLILYPASDYDTNPKKFYIMGGASAIIMSYELADRMGRKITLKNDADTMDDNMKFRYGICSFTNIDKLSSQLEELNISRVEVEEDDRLIGYRLLRNYEASDLARLLEDRKKQIEQANRVYYATVLYPDLHKKIIGLKRLVPPRVKHMSEPYRSILGAKLLDSLWSVIRSYSRMTHGDMEAKEAGSQMRRDFDDMLAMLSWLQETEAFDMSTCSRIGLLVVEAQMTLKTKIGV